MFTKSVCLRRCCSVTFCNECMCLIILWGCCFCFAIIFWQAVISWKSANNKSFDLKLARSFTAKPTTIITMLFEDKKNYSLTCTPLCNSWNCRCASMLTLMVWQLTSDARLISPECIMRNCDKKQKQQKTDKNCCSVWIYNTQVSKSR